MSLQYVSQHMSAERLFTSSQSTASWQAFGAPSVYEGGRQVISHSQLFVMMRRKTNGTIKRHWQTQGVRTQVIRSEKKVLD